MGVFNFLKGRENKPDYSKVVRRVAVYKRQIIIRNRAGRTEADRDKEMRRIKNIGWTFFNAKDYINEKSNQNLLITGSSGQGKSKLVRLMLEMFPNPKTIFSFKKGDEYLQIEGNMIYAEKSLPNPFSDPDAFTSAFAVASSASLEGIQMSIAMSLARQLAADSGSWKEFAANAKKMEESRDGNTRAAAAYVLQKTHNFTYNPNQIELDLNATNVIDFSYLNEEAKTFYAELFLRQIYNQIRDKPTAQKAIICVDEAHRLTRNRGSKHSSVFGEMSKEVRAFGLLWTATQNLTDIVDDVRNNFATQFCFNTTSQEDMYALSSVDPNLARCASELGKHEFIDAKTKKVHDAIWIYKADVSGLSQKPIEDRSPMRKTETKTSEKAVTMPFPPDAERPTATMHAALLAIQYSKGKTLAELVKYLKGEKLITGDPTIYGAKGRKGIFDVVISLGLAKKVGDAYTLTEKGMKWIKPERIIEKAPNLGSDLHKQLLIKTIQILHKKNMLVTAPGEVGSFDLIAYPVDLKKKYLWDDKNRRAYEIQTTARKDSVLQNAKKRDLYKMPITWVCYDNDMLGEIKKLTDNKDEYLLIKV